MERGVLRLQRAVSAEQVGQRVRAQPRCINVLKNLIGLFETRSISLILLLEVKIDTTLKMGTPFNVVFVTPLFINIMLPVVPHKAAAEV